MRAWRTLLATLSAGALVALVTAPVASADPVSDAVTALASSSLYVGDPSAVLDKTAVEAVLKPWMKVAVLPTGSGSATALANQIGEQLDPNRTEHIVVAVVAGNVFGAGSSAYCTNYAEAQATSAVGDNATALTAGGAHPDLTALLKDFAARVSIGPLAGSAACSGSNGAGATASGSRVPAASGTFSNVSASSPTSVWPWLIGIVVLVVLVIGGIGFYQRGKRRTLLAEARANVEPYYDRLASELNNLDAGDNAVARQALADASERFTSAGSQLHAADSVPRFAMARRTVLEGLYAARTARTALGLDEGPPLPTIYDGPEQQLTEAREVNVSGQTFQGYPNYTPGAPYYYGGGAGVPGGWYGTPFWETLLIGSVLTGGFGGGWGWGGGWGGGYGNNYGAGYDAGYQAGDNAGQNAAGDWGAGGGGSGGDWGSGGGNWGGGGGDWGGGGGDFGGGGGDAGGSW